METWKLVAIPVIGFLIGYFTNYVAIKMLFYPRRRVLGFQGILPKRKRILAKNIGEAAMHVLPANVKKLEKVPFFGDKILGVIKEAIEKEINDLSNDELERIIMKVVRKELSFITWMGGLLGFLIGLVQVLIILV